MRYIDVCSGISAPTAAWKPLGWQALCYAEIEAAPRAVLQHHYPNVPLVGDFTQIKGDEYGPVDLLVGGTPCQSFSIAGLRGGLADERGNLALEYLRLADRARPRWLVWENVPGVLSIDGGRAFGAILGGMAELGYGFAYCIRDAQHFGVPQRRRRVFVVGYLGDWRRAAAVLFERHGLSGNPAPRREKGQSAPTIPSRSTGGGGLGTDFDCDGGLIASTGNVAHCLNADGMGRQDYETETMVIMERGRNGEPNLEWRADGTANAILTPNGGRGGLGVGAVCTPVAFDCKGTGVQFTENGIHPPLRSMGHKDSHTNAGGHAAVAYSIMPMNSGKDYKARETDVAQPVMAGGPVGGNQGGDYIVSGVRDGQLDDRALARAEDMPAGAMREVRRGKGGSSSQERRLAGQRAVELGAALSELSHQGASPEEALRHLRSTPEGARLLQQALPEVQTLGRPNADQGQPEHPRSAVRRLTPRECERLQGFPDDFTLIPYRSRMMADGPRYKMLGNSMAVPVMAWLGQRIQRVEQITQRIAA